jgi:hypothetical protein
MENLIKKSFLQKANTISISASLAFIALGTSTLTQSCNSTSENAEDYEEVDVLTKGVKSYIQETAPGEFKISKEEATQASDTEAIISYLDGHTESIATSRAQIMIDDEIRMNPDSIGKVANLPNALLFGGMGYFLANLPGSKLGQYRADDQSANQVAKNDTVKHRNNGHHSGIGFFPLFWMSRAAYFSGSRVQESMAASKMRTTRPISGRTGFFRGSSRGGFSG